MFQLHSAKHLVHHVVCIDPDICHDSVGSSVCVHILTYDADWNDANYSPIQISKACFEKERKNCLCLVHLQQPRLC